MDFSIELEAIDGAKNLRDWFGYWPSFQDVEVIGYTSTAGPLLPSSSRVGDR